MNHDNTPLQIDTLILARWVIPVVPANVTLENHAIAIKNGRILEICPKSDALERYEPQKTWQLDQHVVIPGLINLHTHAAMSLLRGYADDLPLMPWLQEKIWPAEGRLVSPEFVKDGTLLAAAEMLRGGITCFQDMYFFPDAAAQACLEAGIRATLGITVTEFPTPYAADADQYLALGLAAADQHRSSPLLNFSLAPHAPYTVANKTFERIATLSAELNLPIHTHLHETPEEIQQSLEQHGIRPIERLQRLGLINRELCIAHAVHLEQSEIDLLAERGVTIAHCPTSNMKLASGIAPIQKAIEAGIAVGLGSDGAASNNRLDLFQEMRLSALLAKVTSGDASTLPAHRALRMATLDGAIALNQEENLGSLSPGKLADICAVELDDWQITPVFDPASHLIYTAGREHVSHVWVSGNIRVANGQLNELNVSKLLANAALWQNRLMS